MATEFSSALHSLDRLCPFCIVLDCWSRLFVIAFSGLFLHLIAGVVCSQLDLLDCFFAVDCHTSLECQ